MNILFSCDEYPPAKSGGIGIATKTVAENLAARGHNVYVVSGRFDKSLPEKAVINGVTVYRLYLMQEIAWLFKDNFFISKFHNVLKNKGALAGKAEREYRRKQDFIEEIIRSNKVDIVEIPDYNILSKYYSSFRILSCPRFSIPSVARVHGSMSFLSYYREGWINSSAKANDAAFFQSVDNILAVSRFAGDFVNKILGVKKKCDVIYNPLVKSFVSGLDTDDTKRDKTIVFLGKIIKTKGAFNLLEAFNDFSLKYPDYKLVMIGGGDIATGRKKVAPEISGRVLFTGYLSPGEIARYLKKASFCVIPSYFENFSMATLEVMGFGNILIYTSESSGSEVIEDGVNGFLVNPRDSKAILEKMVYVADNLNKIAGIRDAARKSIFERFSEDVIVDGLEKYYLNHCNK